MSDFEREERAFREALQGRGAEAPTEPVVVAGSRRRAWWVAGAAAAAVVAAIAVPVMLSGGDREDRPPAGSGEATTNASLPTRWVSHLGTEIAVPEDWGFDYGPVRPDCIARDGDPAKDPWAEGTPTAPYVEIEPLFRGVPAIGCMPERPKDLPDAFGDLPFELWQPHVLLQRRDYAGAEGDWTYRGWTLTRRIAGQIAITVLAAPGQDGLGETIVGTAREVGTDANGCATRSPVQDEQFRRPTAPPVPQVDQVELIAVCEYVRGTPDQPGLLASRQITGAEAGDLARAIRDAPTGGGPDKPKNCTDDLFGDLAISLRFLPTDWVARDIAYPEAYVYYDWCFGNGVFDSDGARQLTEDNCAPLFREAPVRMWGGSSHITGLCWTEER